MSGSDQAGHKPIAQDGDDNIRDQMERELVEQLDTSEPELGKEEQDALVRARISPKYEVRIQTTLDPIVQETIRYRELAREVDNRYDNYMDRVHTSYKSSGQADEQASESAGSIKPESKSD